MAKNKIILDVEVNDKGGTKKLGVESKKTAKNLDNLGDSSRTADRNIKGAAQASSGASKNFSKMAQGAGGLVGVYATLAATAFAVSAAFNFLKSAMDFTNLLEGQKAMGAVTGVAYKTISDSLVNATNGQLKYAEAAKAAAIGTASGISPDQLARLGAAAKNASIALGRDLGDSFDRLIRGVTKAEPELLDELGIILRLENATRKYGLVIGKSAGDLNEFERSQAVANEVLEQAERKFGAMEKMMDPTAFALNQFAKSFDDIINTIKSGISGPLAATASFLANNMLALSGAVALFAGGLLKQVLPSMTAWKESSQATAAQVKRDQKAVQLRLERTKRSYEKLKTAQMDSHKAAKQNASNILKGTSGGTKSGAGALDYLRGDSSSKKSRAAAKKALAHADEQIRTSAKKRTGILRNMNAQQVADLKRSYEIRGAIHKKGMTEFNFHMKKGQFAVKSFSMQLTSMAAGATVAFAKLGSAAASAGKVLGKAFFWLSMLSIAYDGFKMIKEAIFPTSEAAKKLAKDTENLTEKYETLRLELERTVEVMKDYSMLNSAEMIQTRGKATASLDVGALITDMNMLAKRTDKGSREYKKLFNRLDMTAHAAAHLDRGFFGLHRSLQKGEIITADAAKEYINISNDIQNLAMTLEKLPSKINSMDTEFTKLTGTMKKPFASALITNVEEVIKAQKIAFKGLKRENSRQASELNTYKFDNKQALAGADHLIESFGADVIDTEMFDVYRETYKERERLSKQLEGDIASTEKMGEKTKNLEAFNKNLATRKAEITRLESEQSTAAKDSIKFQTVGVTIQDKMQNIMAKNLVLRASVNDELLAQEVLMAKKGIYLDEEGKQKVNLTEAQKEELRVINENIDANEIKVTQAEYLRDLGIAKNNIAINELAIQGQLLEQQREMLTFTKAQTMSALRLAKIRAGGTGTYGQARVNEEHIAIKDDQQKRLATAKRALEDANTNLSTRTGDATSSQAQINAASAAQEGARAGLALIKQEIALYNDRYAIAMLNVKADTESARLKAESISMNPAMTAFNIKMNELKSQNIHYNEQEQAFLYAEIQAQTLLNKMAEQKQALFDGIAGAMNNAFQSIVTGTASAKQAFASMAISILSQISQMIIQMMVMRMLMSFFTGPMPMAAPQASSLGSSSSMVPSSMGGFMHQPNSLLSNGHRNGGVFSQGKRMQGYAAGGVARGSTSGYPAMLHGTEAVVPLPNGRSIPVEMKDSGATNNNIVVNVSTDGQTSREGSTGPDMDKLGNSIAKAVQVELQNQKRSGGILNPYGVA